MSEYLGNFGSKRAILGHFLGDCWRARQKNPEKLIKQKESQMNAAVKILDFETAAILRDEIEYLKSKQENIKK